MKNTFTRREALAGGLAALAFLPSFSLPTIKKFNISIQLYSLRDAMAKDPAATLAKVSKMGYRQVEPASYVDHKIYGYTAEAFRKITDDLGLSVLTSHTPFKKEHWTAERNDITDAYKKTIEDALITGQKLMVIPGFDWNLKDTEDIKRGTEAFNRMGEIALSSGLHIAFHNHHQEFATLADGTYIYDFLLKNWDLKYVSQQLDIANMAIAGVDPMVFLKKYPHYFASIHVKDLDKSTTKSTHLGEGRLDLETILSFAKRSTQIQYWVIEQEDYGNKTSFQAMEDNLNRFKRYGFIG